MKCTAVAIAVILLLAAAPARSADPIGRFFFTPAQRAQLDTARSQYARGIATLEPAETAPPPKTVTYNGMVRRSDGKSTVWINNHPVQGQDPTGVAVERVRPDGVVTLKVPQSNRDVQLKVGQSVDVVSGTIEEPFDRRRVAPKAAANSQATGESGKGIAPVERDRLDRGRVSDPSPSVSGKATEGAANRSSRN